MPHPKQHPPLARRLWLAAFAAALALSARADVSPVPTVVVGAAPSSASFELDASLQAVQQSTVAAQVGGNVLALLVQAGDRVRTGQVLARIDERGLSAELAQRNAAVARAEAEAGEARQNAERTRALHAQGFISSAAVDTAAARTQGALAALQQAQAAQAQAALARGFALVRAPFDALVMSTHLAAGDLAAPGRPIATLYAPQRLRAVVQVPASRSAWARAADRVQIRLPTGRWVDASARTELPGTDAVAQTVEWRLDLPAEITGVASALRPGQALRVRFSAAAASATGSGRLTLPAAAVLRRSDLSAVYAVQDERFVLKAVRLGAAQGDAIEVLAGLKAGERVALDPVRAGLRGARPAPAR